MLLQKPPLLCRSLNNSRSLNKKICHGNLLLSLERLGATFLEHLVIYYINFVQILNLIQ